jgi:hypothetical protein
MYRDTESECDGVPPTPAAEWDRDAARRALDELFTLARRYQSSQQYIELLRFIARFRFYSPFNAMLIHAQMPGAQYVAPPHRWENDYGRGIRAGARPIVILRPKGPVMFVFDVSDTYPFPDALDLPDDVLNPFGVRSGRIGDELLLTVENAARDGIEVIERDAGSQSAGQVGEAVSGRKIKFQIRHGKTPGYMLVPVRYELLLNQKHSPESRYATLSHELGHLYCGHLGTPEPKWWPDRRGLTYAARELEAESVCYLVCTRLGIDNPSAEYLATYMKHENETAPISLECVMKAAGLIEQMGRERLKMRKNAEE